MEYLVKSNKYCRNMAFIGASTGRDATPLAR